MSRRVRGRMFASPVSPRLPDAASQKSPPLPAPPVSPPPKPLSQLGTGSAAGVGVLALAGGTSMSAGNTTAGIRGVRSSSCFRWSLRSLRVASSAIGSLRYRSTVSSDRWFPLNKPTRIQITGASQVSIDTWNCCRRFDAVATGGSCGSGMRRRSDVADLVSCTIPKRLLCVSRSRSEHA